MPAVNMNVIDNSADCAPEIKGGAGTRIGIIRKCDVISIPVRTAYTDEVANDDVCKVIGTFELKPDTKHILVDCIPGSVSYKAEMQGEIGSRSFHPTGEFKVQDQLTAAALAKRLINTPCYILIMDGDDKQIMVGNTQSPAYIAPSYDMGMKAADARGYSFTWEVEGQFIPVQYMDVVLDLEEE